MSATLTQEAALAGPVRAHCLGGEAESPLDLAAALVGLHNTTQHTPFLSVRARMGRFMRADLETVMWERWALVRFRAMRLTMFVFPIDLLELATSATRHLTSGFAERWLRDSGLTSAEFDRIAADVEQALADGPLTTRDLRDVLDVRLPIDLPGIVGRMCDTGRLVGGAPPRSWRSSIRRYHRWGDVLPAAQPFRWAETEAIRELVRRYVAGYGPVTIDDIAWWTGISKARCRAALADLEVEEVTVDGWPGPLWRFPDSAGRLPDAVRALPMLDPYVQGYRDRTRFLEPAWHNHVYDGGGNSAATVVHRGRIIGVWQVVDKPSPSVHYHLFGDQSQAVRHEAEHDLAAAGAFYFDRPIDVEEIKAMTSLRAEGGGRSAAHPLDGRRHRASRRDR